MTTIKPELATDAKGPAKLEKSPALLAGVARKVNELCNWVASLEAGPGISITKIDKKTVIGIRSGANGQPGVLASELHYNDGTTTVDIAGTGINITYAGHSLVVDPTLITQNMSVRTINVCSGGISKSMLIIGSAPF